MPRFPRFPTLLLLAFALLALPPTAQAADPPYVAGWALLDHDARVAGGKVEVRSMKGRNLVIPADRGTRTSKRGTFEVRLRTMPKRFVISVKGGRTGKTRFRGTLRTVVPQPPGRRLVEVSPLSTVVAARVDRHGSINRAEREVRRYFRISKAWHLYNDERRVEGQFDGLHFARNAARRGGFDRRVARISRNLKGSTLAYRPRARATASITPKSAAMDFAKKMADMAGGKIGDWAFGQILSVLGFGDGQDLAEISRKLDEISNQLNEISAQLTVLEKEVLALQTQVAQSTYSTLHSQLGITWVGSATDPIRTNIEWLVDHAAGCDPKDIASCMSAIPGGADPITWCATTTTPKQPVQATACDTLDRINALELSNDTQMFQERVVGGPGATGALIAYQQAAYIAAKNGEGVVGTTYADNATSIKERYSWITALGSYYASLRAVAKGLPQEIVQTGLTNAQKGIEAQGALMPTPIPAGTILDLKTNLVWTAADGFGPACGGTDSRHGFYPNQVELQDQLRQPCQAWWDRTRASGSNIGSTAEVAAFLGRWKGQNVGEILTGHGLPDLTVPAAKDKVPAPDRSMLTDKHIMYMPDLPTQDNPGTASSIGAGCARRTWYSGVKIIQGPDRGPWYQVDGIFCDVFDLKDGAQRSMCVVPVGPIGWTSLSSPWNLPCSMPVLKSTYTPRMGNPDGPLDYGHPVAYLLRRDYKPEDNWIVKG